MTLNADIEGVIIHLLCKIFKKRNSARGLKTYKTYFSIMSN